MRFRRLAAEGATEVSNRLRPSAVGRFHRPQIAHVAKYGRCAPPPRLSHLPFPAAGVNTHRTTQPLGQKKTESIGAERLPCGGQVVDSLQAEP